MIKLCNEEKCVKAMYTVHCTGKAGGVQTESRPGFDRRQYDCADNKVMIVFLVDLNGFDRRQYDRVDNKVMILMDNKIRLNCVKKDFVLLSSFCLY